MIWFALISLIFVVAIIMLDGKLGWHMVEVPEGSMKFVTAGGDYIRTILNVKGRKMVINPDTGEEEIGSGSPTLSFSLVRLLGFHWVSWLWPARKIHRFVLTTNELLEKKVSDKGTSDKDPSELPLKDRVRSKEHPTDRLDLMIRSFFLLKDVELKGQFKVDIVVFALMEIVNPRLAVFMYSGDFVKILGSAILSGYVDNAKTFDIIGFTDEPKGRGSKFATTVCDYVNQGGTLGIGPDEIEKRYGVRLVETYVYEFDQSDIDLEVLKATTAQKVAELQAEARRIEARGKADARKTEAAAKAEELTSNVVALRNAGVDPNVAMQHYAMIRSTENIPSLQTWVQGGGAIPAISAGSQTPIPQTKEPKEKSS